MCWAAAEPARHSRRALTRALLLVIAASVPWAAAQDLLPQEAPGRGASLFRFAPAPDLHGWAADDSPVLIDPLRELVVTGSEAGMAPVEHAGVRLERMSVEGLDALAVELSGWIGRPLTERGLDRLTEVILRHYDDHDRPMNEVWVPPQGGEGGRLQVELVEGRVGAVGLESTRHFDAELLRGGLRVRPGGLLRGDVLQADLDWLSRNPFRHAELFVSPGEGVSADLLIRVDERRPWRVYTGWDNSGAESVGRNRWFAGFNWGDAFGLDQLLGYQFTTGDATDAFIAHSLSWEVPIHRCQQFLRLTGAWADVSAVESQGGQPVNSDGTSWQITALWGRPLPRLGLWRHEVRCGPEFKRADNFVIFGQTTLPQTAVDIVQLRGEWRGSGPLWGGLAELEGNLVLSPGDLTGRNGRAEFEAFRAGADPTYAYGRLEGTWLRPVGGDWSCRVHATGQVASGALLPTEQLGLGGRSTVRGYAERILLADSGYAFSAELRTPAWGPPEPSWAGALQLQGLAFVDHGRGWREGGGDESLTGVGIGARAAFGARGSARLDLGWGLENGRGAEVHAGVTLSF